MVIFVESNCLDQIGANFTGSLPLLAESICKILDDLLTLLPSTRNYYFCPTVENGHFKYWLPLGKTFGESDVPFAITHLVSFITSLFNLFTLCAFWIDDGIIQVGNINNENWVETASCIRSFTAFLFSALCLLVNQKCDFQPSIEKP